MIGEAPIGEAPIGEAAAVPGGDLKQQIVDFMTGFTAETTPGSAAKIADYREHLRPGKCTSLSSPTFSSNPSRATSPSMATAKFGLICPSSTKRV